MPKPLTTAEAAAYLGVRPSLLKRLRDHRQVPYLKLGHRTIVYDPKDLDAFLRRCRVKAVWEHS